MKHSLRFLLLLSSLIFLSGQALGQTVPPLLVSYPEMILHNGKIATMDDKSTTSNPGTIVQALAIRDGKILATGNNQQMLELREFDLQLAFPRAGAARENVEDERRAIEDFAVENSFQVDRKSVV